MPEEERSYVLHEKICGIYKCFRAVSKDCSDDQLKDVAKKCVTAFQCTAEKHDTLNRGRRLTGFELSVIRTAVSVIEGLHSAAGIRGPSIPISNIHVFDTDEFDSVIETGIDGRALFPHAYIRARSDRSNREKIRFMLTVCHEIAHLCEARRIECRLTEHGIFNIFSVRQGLQECTVPDLSCAGLDEAITSYLEITIYECMASSFLSERTIERWPMQSYGSHIDAVAMVFEIIFGEDGVLDAFGMAAGDYLSGTNHMLSAIEEEDSALANLLKRMDSSDESALLTIDKLKKKYPDMLDL